MYLQSLQLANFKNYESGEFTFNEKVNAVVGENGSGKTNLLDAIHYLSFCKSYFNSQDNLSVRFGADFFAIHGEFVGYDDDRTRKISCIYKSGGRKIMKFNQKEYERMSDHIGQYPLIMAAPVDSNLIHGGSELRRKFFDMILSQFDKNYLQALISYQKLLMQRNTLLKQMFENGHYDAMFLQIYDDQMCPLADEIHQKRMLFTQEIQPFFQKYYEFLSESKEKVDIGYESALADMPMAEIFRNNEQADYRSGYTCSGVHKDDFIFLMDGHSVKKFSSQGQQKSFLLALKLAHFDYIYNKKKLKPILLLDDIFDKLDEKRIAQLLYLVGNDHFGQVFLSNTDGARIERILSEHNIQYTMLTVGA